MRNSSREMSGSELTAAGSPTRAKIGEGRSPASSHKAVGMMPQCWHRTKKHAVATILDLPLAHL